MAILLDGVVFGLQLSLLAVGLTLVYGLGGVLNLAHGQFTVVSAIVASLLIGRGLGAAPAIVIALAAAAALALLIDITLLRPIYRLQGDARVLASLLITLGVAFLLDGLLISAYPFAALNLSTPGAAVEVLGVRMRSSSIAASAIALAAIVALIVFLASTRVGRAIRSIMQDETGAALCGIDATRMRRSVFVLGGALAGLVAVTQGLVASVGASSGLDLTILALIVTVVGGLGRVPGTLVAGLLLGIVHAAASFHLGASATQVILLLAAVVAILVRPSGILGKAS